MSSAPSPEPHRGDAGESAPRSSDQPAPVPQPRQEPRAQRYRTDREATHRPFHVSAPSHNIDIRRRYFDPFVIGIVVGAFAAAIGFLIGMIYVLLN